MLVHCLAWFSILKTEAKFSSETLFALWHTTWICTTNDRNLRSHACENLESYADFILLSFQLFIRLSRLAQVILFVSWILKFLDSDRPSYSCNPIRKIRNFYFNLRVSKSENTMRLVAMVTATTPLKSWHYTLLNNFTSDFKLNLRGPSLRANATYRAIAACRRNYCQLLRIRGRHVVTMMYPLGLNLGFLDRSRYFFFQVAPQLYSRGWVDLVPDPLLLGKSDSAGNRTQTSGSGARNSDH
jgi:hypothetical protein